MPVPALDGNRGRRLWEGGGEGRGREGRRGRKGRGRQREKETGEANGRKIERLWRRHE